jgi:hypothetical protein
MGREAECTCDWNGTSAHVKALIEPPELILRGGLKHRIPFVKMQHVRADGEWLRFDLREASVGLKLGSSLVAKWVQYLTTLPPSLAKKLGITSDTVVRMVGKVDDEALIEVLALAHSSAGSGSGDLGDLILARVNTPQELLRALVSTADQLDQGVPIWFIYPKGKGHPLTENDVRFTALASGIVDTKVASVSPRLTALRFVKRRTPRQS